MTAADHKSTTTSAHEAKAQLREKIIAMVRHVEDTFSLGVRFYSISQKMNSIAKRHGIALDTLLREMNDAGDIFLYTDENFSRLVMTPEMREHYKLGVIGEETEETRNFIKAKWGRKPKGRAQ